MKWSYQNKEVFYPKERGVVLIDKKDVDYLQEVACGNPRQRARFCAHSSVNDQVHEMIIFHKKGTYVRPHKHVLKTESFHLLEGEADLLIFDKEGNLAHVQNLGKYESGKCFYYRIPESCYHTQIFRKDTVFHEATKGPFERKDTVLPAWAPEEDEHLKVTDYMKKLNIQVQSFLK